MFDRRFLDFNFCVEGIANDTPSGFSPTAGVQFIVGSEPEGYFSDAQPNYIARYDSDYYGWRFLPPQQDFFEVFNLETHELLKYDGSNWVKATKFENFYTVDDIVRAISTEEPPFSTSGITFNDGEYVLHYYEDEVFLVPILHNDFFNYSYGRNEYPHIFPENNEIYLALNEKAIIVTKYHGNDETTFFTKSLLKGDTIYCKANKSLYYFDGTNIVKIKSKQVYTVKNIADKTTTEYRNNSFDITLPIGTKLLSCYYKITFVKRQNYGDFDKFIYEKQTEGNIYACLQDQNNNVAIFTLRRYEPEFTGTIFYWQSETLSNGDIVFNEADGCTYVYDGTSLKNLTGSNGKKVYHVADIGISCHEGDDISSQYNVYSNPNNLLIRFNEDGDDELYDDDDRYETSGYSWGFYSLTWVYDNNGNIAEQSTIPSGRLQSIDINTAFLDINDKCIWIGEANNKIRKILLQDDAIIYNDNDGSAYSFSLATGAFTPYIVTETNAPVNDIIEVVATLPDNGVNIGDKFLKLTDAKIYTVTNITTQNNNDVITWDAGVATSNGDRYASKNEKIIYTSKGTYLTASPIVEGSTFLNKADGYIYICTNEGKIKAVDEYFTEVHTIGQTEATNKTFNLTYSVKSGKETNLLCFVAGNIKTPNVDFTVSGNTFTWTTANFAENDVVIIHYIKA